MWLTARKYFLKAMATAKNGTTKQRAAVLMHKYQGLDYSQISEALGCTESAVKSLLFRAYETLRLRLAHMA